MINYSAIKQLFANEQKQHPFRFLQETVYTVLMNAILSFQLQPGDCLNDGAIAYELCVSRTPVRHALMRLEEVGFVTKSKFDYVVINIDWCDVREVMYVRQAIEPTAAALLTKRLTSKSYNILKKELANMKCIIYEGKFLDPCVFATMEVQFHKLIVTLSENKPLITLYESMETAIIRSYQRFSYENTFNGFATHNGSDAIAYNFYRTHSLLIDIIKMGNHRIAHDVMQEHLEMSISKVPYSVNFT